MGGSTVVARLSSMVDNALTQVSQAIEHAGEFTRAPDAIRTRLRVLCVLARQEQVPVEVLVAHLKGRLGHSVSVRALSSSSRQRIQAEAVRYLISAYYSDTQ